MKKNIAQKVEELVLPVVEGLGYELVDTEFVKEAGMYYLRLIVDSENGIGLDECEEVSREVNPILDEKDFIEENYFLEVCSPGIDRVLKRDKEFTKYAGRDVEVKLYSPEEVVGGSKHFEATLIGLDGDDVLLNFCNNEIRIERKKIAQIRLLVVF